MYTSTNIYEILSLAGLLTPDNKTRVAKHQRSVQLMGAIDHLHKANILIEKNFSLVVASANPFSLAEILCVLHQCEILTEDNLALVLNHTNLNYLARAISHAQRSGILSQVLFASIVARYNPYSLVVIYSLLNQVGILAENQDRVFHHTNFNLLTHAISDLLRAKILNQKNFILVADSPEPLIMSKMVIVLHQAKILECNRGRIACHVHPYQLEPAISNLFRAGILDQDVFEQIVASTNPSNFASVLLFLNHFQILTPANQARVAAVADLFVLNRVLYCIRGTEILTQNNVDKLLAPNHAILITDEGYRRIWETIPTHLLTEINFQRLLTAAENVNPIAALERERHRILELGHAQFFNPAQSTHRVSVHRSVSVSALKLMRLYGHDLNLEDKIQEIKDFADGLADTPKHQAVKRCIQRITADDYTHLDEGSQISTRQLLALAYVAIHDASKCSATLEDAKALFVEGLYEIQRGYNIEEGEVPGLGEDKFVCSSGTFNKVIEKLNGIHPDVEVYFITHEGALSKFGPLAYRHALTYLQSLASPVTADDYCRVKDLLERLKIDGTLEPIWENIKLAINYELWDEFKEAYGDNPNHHQFLSLIGNGHYLSCPDLSYLKTMLLSSLGYQTYLDEQARLSLEEQKLLLSLEQHSLWYHRFSSHEAQASFDKKYGLVLRN